MGRRSWLPLFALGWLAVPGCHQDVLPRYSSQCRSLPPPEPCSERAVCPSYISVARARQHPEARVHATVPELRCCLLDGYPEAASALAESHDAAAIEALGLALGSGDFGVQAAALDALASIGPDAAELTSRVEALAGHWAPVVRASAVHAALAIAGHQVPDVAPRGPAAITRSGGGWEVRTATETIRLAPVGDPEATPVPPACAPLVDSACIMQPSDLRHAIELDGACFFACSYGEFGGAVVRSEHGLSCPIEQNGNALRFVRAHGEFLVIEGSWHVLGATAGRVTRVARAPEGWRSSPVARLPGGPFAYGFDASGNLVLLADVGLDAQRSWRAPHPTQELINPQGPMAMRLTSGGELVVVH